jgi:hypothetical protein
MEKDPVNVLGAFNDAGPKVFVRGKDLEFV